MKIFSQRSLSALAISGVAFGTLALAGTAFAANIIPMQNGESENRTVGAMNTPRSAVMGTVSAINGTTFTVTAKNRMMRGNGVSGSASTAVATPYTINTTNVTTITKNGASANVSDILVGDTVSVQGTVSGSTVTATAIRDVTGQGMKGQKSSVTQSPLIQGNGQPIVGGTVSAISGNTVTITNKSNVTYTIDATNATITKVGVTGTATIANVVVGDSVVIQGTVNGTSVTASSVIDQGTPPSKPSISGSPEGTETHGGFFGAIGGFFSHLFGF